MLRMAQAQQLYDGLDDPLLNEALQDFFKRQRETYTDELLSAVRQHIRDNQKESRLAGKVEVYEEILSDLRRYAEEQIKSATQ